MDKKIIWKYLERIEKFKRIRLEKALKKYKIKCGQGEILALLKHTGDGKNQKEISQMLAIDQTTVSRTIQRLIKNGYITREKDGKDGRMSRIYLTKKIEEITKTVRTEKEEMIRILTKNISEKEFESFIKTLDKMYKNINEGNKYGSR